MKRWDVQNEERQRRIAAGASFASGKAVDSTRLAEFLSAVIQPGDRVCLEGNNQKQADMLACALADADPHVLYDLHMVPVTNGPQTQEQVCRVKEARERAEQRANRRGAARGGKTKPCSPFISLQVSPTGSTS
jgi:Malonate decarboxylase, alpha subunit, transporter